MLGEVRTTRVSDRKGPFDKLRVSGQEARPLVVSLSNHSLSEQNTENEMALHRRENPFLARGPLQFVVDGEVW